MESNRLRRVLTNHKIISVTIFLAAFGIWGLQISCTNSSEVQTEQSSDVTDSPQRLTGRWLRPDGNYVLEIRRVHSDGQVEAAYLNPRPINIAEARIEEKQGKLKLLVILRDKGYPGSYYDLIYDPSHDQLIGDYYQATMGEVFDVQFVRLPE